MNSVSWLCIGIAGLFPATCCHEGSQAPRATASPSNAGVSPSTKGRHPKPADVPQRDTETVIHRNAPLGKDGRVTIDANGIGFVIEAHHCETQIGAYTVCTEGVVVTVSGNGGVQQLRPDAFYLDANATLFRGPLSAHDRTRSQSIIVSDMNLDGVDDVALWSGRQGGYGAASYDIHLFDARSNRYVYSDAFSRLTVGNMGFFTHSGNRIQTASKSGCCFHRQESFEVHADIPVLVERLEEDSSGTGRPRRRVFRRIQGEMREVEDRR